MRKQTGKMRSRLYTLWLAVLAIGCVVGTGWVMQEKGAQLIAPAQEAAPEVAAPAEAAPEAAAPAEAAPEVAAPAEAAPEAAAPAEVAPEAAAPADSAVETSAVTDGATAGSEHAGLEVHWFEPFTVENADGSKGYPWYEQIALLLNLVVAVAGLFYALTLVKQVRSAEKGTEKMQAIASAVREGANAYLYRQFRVVACLIVVITFALYFGATASGLPGGFAWGRAGAFAIGALFSGTVGFVGMRLATTGNLRVAAAAKGSFGHALQLGYRTGTITGMLTDGLGLLGGSMIFLIYGTQAYEALMGFGFGGTLLALFMRVGGGIYTKAADVGADLVGKLEAGIPEDDPRNAATIADNVGDNVGDCAGMAADIFESYEVTIVAAMILGLASYGHKGVIFPLLVRAIGVVASIISTYSVRAGDKGSVAEAMKSVNKGFAIGATISIVGFIALSFFYMHFTPEYWTAMGTEAPTAGWITLGQAGLDMRPAWACMIGIILAVCLNKCTEYYTGTEYAPVKELNKSCTTGHATNIISGFALGYESTVMMVLIIAASLVASVLVYSGADATFVGYSVAMCGIGMLTLTGNTISMDVFGPVADNANGIGEMGFDKDEMGEESYNHSRQILADLDAVGNTTKAITKGIAIGSAVIAAVSLFNSFIVCVGSGGQGEAAQVAANIKTAVASWLSVADPILFVGLLIGGAAPFLFSSMTIRAVGRAAYLIVLECRKQFRDKEIWAGTKKPDYARVVDICTSAAQKELIGPALLALLLPILVGFALGTVALAGFLAGMIVTGQLLAVFMSNAGGAWDNAKKSVEDEPRTETTGKGSEKHKAAITGDTVGDPLKDTAGPAINPLLKVMNMVSMLIIGLSLPYDAKVVQKLQDLGVVVTAKEFDSLFWGVIVVGLVGLVWSVWRSKQESGDMTKSV